MCVATSLGITALLVVTVALGESAISANQLQTIYSSISPFKDGTRNSIAVDLLMIEELEKFVPYPEPKYKYFKGVDTKNNIYYRRVLSICPAYAFAACGNVFGTGGICDALIAQWNYFVIHSKAHGFDLSNPHSSRTSETISENLGYLKGSISHLNEKSSLYLNKIVQFSQCQCALTDTECIATLKRQDKTTLHNILEEVNNGFCPADMFVEHGSTLERSNGALPLVEYYHRFVAALRADSWRSNTRSRR
eukprot:Lankesteria_metandrocarpae@DN1116_c0_g1_i1.p1